MNRDVDDQGNFLGEYITDETPIYVDVGSAFYFINENYGGSVLNSMEDCMYVCRNDIAESDGFYLKLETEDGSKKQDLTPTYVESAVDLIVPPDSQLASRFEVPIKPNNTYRGFISGYVALIKRLDPGQYRLRIGYRGPRGYIMDSVYQLRVRKDNGYSLFTNVNGYEQYEEGKRNILLNLEESGAFPLRRIKPIDSAKVIKDKKKAQN
jgi:hypothetical protein